MAGAIGIVFGLCVLSFTLGAALMYVVLRRREDAAGVSSPADEPVERTWVEKPAAVEPVDEDYDSRPIHRNPVMGLPQLEPALAVLAEPVVEPEPEVPDAGEPDTGEPETVGAARYDRDGDLDPPVGELEAPESTVAPSTDSPEVVEPVAEAEQAVETEQDAEIEQAAETEQAAEVEQDAEPVAEPVVAAALPPPAAPQPVEHTTWVEREDFRQRYLRTFEEVRRKAGSN